MKTLFEVIKNTREIKKAEQIKCGITLSADNQYPETIKSFNTLEDAKIELKKYQSQIFKGSGFYEITEYYVQENVYDEDDEWIDGGDVWEFAPFKISLVSKPEYETIGTFDNMEDALIAKNEYDGDCYISFN